MAAIRLVLGSELRSRWRAWAALALVVGLFGGAVVAVAAGARRTDTSFKRFLATSKAPDMLVSNQPGESGSGFATLDFSRVARLPGVEQTGLAAGYSVIQPVEAGLIAPADSTIGGSFFLRKMLDGREPRPDRADEVAVSFVLAQSQHLGLGDDLRLVLAGADEEGRPVPTTFRFHIVGIDATASEFPPQTETGVQTAWATPAFYQTHTRDLVTYQTLVMRLRNGSRGVPAVMERLRDLGGGQAVQGYATSDQFVNTQHTIHLQAIALWMLAGLLGAASVLVVTQLVVRQSAIEATEYPALSAVGMSPAQLWATAMLRGTAIGIVGAVVAVAVAFFASPLLPVGLARTAEPHPGLAFDGTALGLGALLTAVFVVAAAAWPSWRAARGAADQTRAAQGAGAANPSWVASALARIPTPASVTAGVRLALEPGRGRTAVPVRTTAFAAVVAAAALATALAFTASLSHLLDSPALYGVSWDARVVTVSTDDATPAIPVLRADKRVAELAAGYSGFPATIRGTRVDGIAMTEIEGSTLMPNPVVGRRPQRSDEIMLGSRTMRTLHAHVGDSLDLSVAEAGKPLSYRVVGAGVFPSLSDAMGLGKGLALTVEGLQRALPPGVSAPPPDTLLVRFRPGVDARTAIPDLGRHVSGLGVAVASPDKPVDLLNFGRVQNLPLVLAVLLGALAAATLAHLLVTSIRRRRRDLAIMKTLGFASHQVRSAVAWQATTLSCVSLVVGVPLGVAAGRWIWVVFAHQLGIAPHPATPFALLATLAVATLAVSNLIAILPARAAARLHPAPVLRSE